MLKKLYSKKGQVSMEIGILVAAAVAVSAIASYFYASNTHSSGSRTLGVANNTCDNIISAASNYSDKICNLT